MLVSNTSCNNLVFNPDDLFEQDDPNGILLRLARTVVSCGDTYVDELPVTTAPPFEYTDMSETQRTQLNGHFSNMPGPRRGGHGPWSF